MRNEAGQLALTYKVFRCWVSDFQALPDLDANTNGLAIQKVVLQHDGFERRDPIDERRGSDR